MKRSRAWILAGWTLLAVVAAVVVTVRSSDDRPQEPAPPPTETVTEPAPPSVPEPPSQPTAPTPPPPSTVSFSWSKAGAFVWHETDLDPEMLGRFLREGRFGWVVVLLHDGLTEDPVEADWVYRFRVASGLPVGGWGVLRTDPAGEATLAHTLLGRYGLDFYIANAEMEYEFSGIGEPDHERSARSRTFVEAFRSLRPSPFPVGLSSYCRPDHHDIDWGAWSGAGFAFLPQAYVNDLGDDGAPAECVTGARGRFASDQVHPTIGVHPGRRTTVDVATYVELLDQADTLGFSVYLAETGMTETAWEAFGAAIVERRIAEAP